MPKPPSDKKRPDPEAAARAVLAPIEVGDDAQNDDDSTTQGPPNLADAYIAGRQDTARGLKELLREMRTRLAHDPWCKCCDIFHKMIDELLA